MKELKYLNIITGVYVGALLLVPSLSAKFITIGSLVIVGSTLIFPIVFIINDILTEVYGYRRSRSVIWTGLVMQAFAAIMYAIVTIWPYPEFWTNQEAFATILGTAPRIALASLTAYFLGEFANSIILSKMKFTQNGARGLQQKYRFVLSTLVGEGIDTAVFLTIAFAGIIPSKILITTFLSVWAFKVAYEVVALPFSTRLTNWIKEKEQIDVIDNPNSTNYNPLVFNN